MLTVLSHNPDKTVGLVDGDNPETDLIGPFSPLALQEWVAEIIQHFGDSKPVWISAHKSTIVNSNSLAAADTEYDTLQVMVAGWEMEEME
jgi:hypothetical protein